MTSKTPHGSDLFAWMSLKRLAWAFGVAKNGSDEEKALLAVLVERIQGGQ